MPWIESHTVLLRHRKVCLLALALGIPPVYVVGHLHVLWHAVLEQQEDGDVSTWPDEMIAHAAAYQGDARAFVAALQAQKLLDGKVVHDWLDYAGLFLTKKYSTSNRPKLVQIWKLHGYKYGKRDAKSLHRLANRQRTHSEHIANLPNLTKPNLTEPNQREERNPLHPLPLARGTPMPVNPVNEQPEINPEQLALMWNDIPGVQPILVQAKLADTIRKTVHSRLKKYPRKEFWESFCKQVAASHFLTGRIKVQDREPFVASLPWAMSAKNFDKIISGSYDRNPAPMKKQRDIIYT